MRITSLTAEQEQLMPVVRDEWLAHGLSTASADRDEARRGVDAAYREAGLEPPQFAVWLGSARLLSPEQRRADWADGRCGHCGAQFEEHPPVDALDGIAAATADYLAADVLFGRIFGEQLRYLVAAAELAPDSLERAS